MAKTKIKPDIKTETVPKLDTRWNVLVLNDPINYQQYVILAFMTVLRVDRTVAQKLMMAVHNEGRAIVWSGDREPAEMVALELQQWHLQAQLEKDA
ncbi:MAG: ATP-dependent Clp protease adaptor ClpS [Opitutae bacterium]